MSKPRLVAAASIAVLLASTPARSQVVAPVGAHDTSVGPGTGQVSPVSPTGGFNATVPIELPSPRRGLPVPFAIQYAGTARAGVAGIGWDVPIWTVRRSVSTWHRKPAVASNEVGQDWVPERLVLSMGGGSLLMVPGSEKDLYLPFVSDEYMELRETGDDWVLSTAAGIDYRFSPSPSDENLWRLSDVIDRVGTDHVEVLYDGQEIVGYRYGWDEDHDQALYEIALDYVKEAEPFGRYEDEYAVHQQKRKLISVAVNARNNLAPGSEAHPIRTYTLTYAPDMDTGAPRLTAVDVSGEPGPMNTSLPVARYEYGTATQFGDGYDEPVVELGPGDPIPVDAQAIGAGFDGLGESDVSVSFPGIGGDEVRVEWTTSNYTIRDFTGDAVADLVFKIGDTWHLRRGVVTDAGFSLDSGVTSTWTQPSEIHSQRTLQYDNLDYLSNRRAMITTETLKTFLDWNGDGRLDVLDAETSDPRKWRVWLNLPAADGTPLWQPRDLDVSDLYDHVQEHDLGWDLYWDSTFLPLERSRSWPKLQDQHCYIEVNPNNGSPTTTTDCTPPPVNKEGQVDTVYEWTLTDANGDGFPDFAANTEPVRHCWGSNDYNPPDTYPWHHEFCGPWFPIEGSFASRRDCGFDQYEHLDFGPYCRYDGAAYEGPYENHAAVFLNRSGAFIDTVPRSYGPDELTASGLGVGRWTTGAAVNGPFDPEVGTYDIELDFGISWHAGGFVDTNALGRSRLATGELLEEFDSDRYNVCRPPAAGNAEFKSTQTRGLVDLNGDGVPDWVYRENGDWWVRFGTTAAFGVARPIDVIGPLEFAISETVGTCQGKSRTVAGLVDVDGDGKPELVRRDDSGQLFAAHVQANGGMSGDPLAAGRLTAISNGYGARLEIGYANNKAEALTPHDVPAPEVVVAETELTIDGVTAGPTTRYAYGTADMRFDPAAGRRTFQGYRRMVTLVGVQTGSIWSSVSGTATVVDRLPPASFGAAYEKLVLGGRVEKTTRLEGAFLSDPRPLLASLPASQIRAQSTQSYGVIELPTAAWSAGTLGWLECMDVRPNGDFSGNLDCHQAGIVHGSVTMRWEGIEAPAIGNDNVVAATQVLYVDERARPTEIVDFGDMRTTGDDRCTTIQYADPVAGSAPTTSVVSGVWVTDCGWTNPVIDLSGWVPGPPIMLAAHQFLYDDLPDGEVGRGRVTARLVHRYDTTDGTFLGDYVAETIGHNGFGEVSHVVSSRALGGAATRTTSFEYDPYGATVIEVTETASDVAQPPFVEQIESSTWPSVPHVVIGLNGERSTTERDPFGRTEVERFESGGSSHIVAETDYVDDETGRRISTTTYPADLARPQRSHTYLDALGRPRFSQRELGADYGMTLIEGLVEYDRFGRVFYEASPFEWATNDFDPVDDLSQQREYWPYGVTIVYDPAGRPIKQVEARGQQPGATTTSTGGKVFVSTTEHTWKDERAITRHKGPSENEPGSFSAGARDETLSTALGWVGESVRYTSSGSRVDLVRRGFDRFGQPSIVRRYENPNAMSGTVDWLRRYDSLGQVLSLEEPGTTPLTYSYDEWGGLLQTARWDGLWQEITRHRYDGFGRPISLEILKTNLATPPETVVESTELFHYDEHSGSTWQPPSVLRGRLSRIEAVGVGDTWFEYDDFGRTRSETHLMAEHGAMMRTSHDYLPGGATRELRFDTPAGVDRIEYTLDSAARTREVAIVGGVKLLDIEGIDAEGRPTVARLGNGVIERYIYAPDGRQELLEWNATTPSGVLRHEYLLRDAEGRLVGERYPHAGATLSVMHLYDVMDRLVRSRSIAPSGTASSDETFTYDGLGNLKTKRNAYSSTLNRDYSYDTTDRDRLCRFFVPGQSGTGCTSTYDAAGNLVSDTWSIPRTLTYDSAARVTSITRGNRSATFLYGPAGSLARTEVRHSDSVIRRIWRFGDLIEERLRPDGNTQLERRIPGPLGLIATLRTQGPTTETVYVHGDSRANRFFTTSTGAIAQQVRYRAFGAIHTDTGVPTQITFTDDLWNGGDDLRELGITVLGARMFDTTLGRFLQRDPISHTDSSNHGNPYAFAFNDPVNLNDPTGLSPCIGAENLYCNYGMLGPSEGFGIPSMPLVSLPGFEPIQASDLIDVGRDFLEGFFSEGLALAKATLGRIPRGCGTFHAMECMVEDLEAAAEAGEAYGELLHQFIDDPEGTTDRVVCGEDGNCAKGAGRWTMRGLIALLTRRLAPVPKPTGGVKPGCFVAGTVVLTQEGPVAIEELEIGDLVLARNEETGELAFRRIEQTFVRDDVEIVELVVADDDEKSSVIETTGEHPFWVEKRGFVEVRTLRADDVLRTSDNSAVRVVSVRAAGRTATVFNIEVEDFHTYFVGDVGVWVHNKPMRNKSRFRGKGDRKLKGPEFGDLKDHANRHARDGQTKNDYYNAAVRHTGTGKAFPYRHDGMTKTAYVTRTGADAFTFTATGPGRIYTHIYEVTGNYLRNLGITLPADF